MEVDGKAIMTVLAGLVAGGGSGFAAFEVGTQVQVAKIEAQLMALDDKLDERITEAAGDHAQTRDMVRVNFEQVSERITTAINAMDARMNRMDERLERKADK